MPTCFSIAGVPQGANPTCAVTLKDDQTREWPLATPEQLADFISFLRAEVGAKHEVISYGGASFGLKLIAAKLPGDDLTDLTLDHIDLMYLFVVDNGYRAALASFVSVPPGVSENLLSAEYPRAIAACRTTVAAIYKMYASAKLRGVLMRTARSKQVFPWFIRQELEQPPITIPTVRETKERPRNIPTWIRDPVPVNEPIAWLDH